MKLVKLLANLGYGSRKEVATMVKNGWVVHKDGREWGTDDSVSPEEHGDIIVDDEPLDPPPGLTLLLNKPPGYTCSIKDQGLLVYDLLPPRFRHRNPVLSTVGRLDRDTSGLLLMTDDGQLNHRIISPKAKLPKVYEVTLFQELQGHEAALFASGAMTLESETEPLAPATLEAVAPKRARVTLVEGRYHQVRRMFAATGNHVQTLERISIGGLTLEGLQPGEWKVLSPDEIARIFAAPPQA